MVPSDTRVQSAYTRGMNSRAILWVSSMALGVACGNAEHDQQPQVNGGRAGAGGISGNGGVGARGGEGGSGGSAGEQLRAGTLLESSWDTALSLRVLAQRDGLPVICTSTAFSLHLTPRAETVDVISGRDGVVFGGQLRPTTSGGPPSTYGLAIPMQVSTFGGDCELFSMGVTELALHPLDSDGDGIADLIDGSGKAIGAQIQGDQIFDVDLAFSWHSSPDGTAPALLEPTSSHPLDSASFRATEPLSLDSALSLVNQRDVVPLVSSNAADGALSYFSTTTILPFGATWRLQGAGADLAGLALDLSSAPSLTMLDDPLLFAEDGFESVPNALLVGGAKVVTAIGDLPAITGGHSLLVLPKSSATFHLARPPSATRVRFSVRGLAQVNDEPLDGLLPIQVGVMGGVERVAPAAIATEKAETPTHDTDWPYAGAPHDVSIGLTESGTHVVLRVAPYFCEGLCPRPEALLIDDLRVE